MSNRNPQIAAALRTVCVVRHRASSAGFAPELCFLLKPLKPPPWKRPEKRPGGGGADRCALCFGIHKGPTRPPPCPWQLHARGARALPAATRRSGQPGERRAQVTARQLAENPRPARSLSLRRGPGKREAGSGGASAVGICSPRAFQARVPARHKPTSCRCPNYTSRHPLRCRAESENKFWAARGAALCRLPPPAPRPTGALLRGVEAKGRVFLSWLPWPPLSGVRGTQALFHLSRPRAREGRGFLASPQSGRGNLWGRRPRPGSGARQRGRRGVTSHSRVFLTLPPGCAAPRKAAACARPCTRQGSPMRSERADRCFGPPSPPAARGALDTAAARPRPGREGAGGAAMWG